MYIKIPIKEVIKLEAFAKGKHKICIDENLSGLVPLLNSKGYSTFSFPKGMSDEAIHKELNKKNVRIFLTLNHKDFSFQNRKYSLVGIQKSLVDNNPLVKLAAAIECWFLIMRATLIKQKGMYVILTSEVLRSAGCTQIKR